MSVGKNVSFIWLPSVVVAGVSVLAVRFGSGLMAITMVSLIQTDAQTMT